MSETTIRVRDDGPLVVSGPLKLVDAAGNPIQIPSSDKPGIVLCRCGHSENKPFCDGSHRSAAFRSQVRGSKSTKSGGRATP